MAQSKYLCSPSQQELSLKMIYIAPSPTHTYTQEQSPQWEPNQSKTYQQNILHFDTDHAYKISLQSVKSYRCSLLLRLSGLGQPTNKPAKHRTIPLHPLQTLTTGPVNMEENKICHVAQSSV